MKEYERDIGIAQRRARVREAVRLGIIKRRRDRGGYTYPSEDDDDEEEEEEEDRRGGSQRKGSGRGGNKKGRGGSGGGKGGLSSRGAAARASGKLKRGPGRPRGRKKQAVVERGQGFASRKDEWNGSCAS